MLSRRTLILATGTGLLTSRAWAQAGTPGAGRCIAGGSGETPEPTDAYSDARGRILIADSLTHFSEATPSDAVCIAASFAGVATASYPLSAGVKGWIAHAAGPGKDQAGISGLPLSDELGVPAAAVATMAAGLSDGPSVAEAPIAFANETARALGVRDGMTGRDAALLMLDGPENEGRDVSDRFDTQVRRVVGDSEAGIYTAWSIGLIDTCRPMDVFCVASHSGAA